MVPVTSCGSQRVAGTAWFLSRALGWFLLTVAMNPFPGTANTPDRQGEEGEEREVRREGVGQRLTERKKE